MSSSHESSRHTPCAVRMMPSSWFVRCVNTWRELATFSLLLLLTLTTGCQETTSQANSGGATLATSVEEDAGAKILYRQDGVAEASFDALKFEFQEDGSFSEDDLTEEIKALDGKPIVIQGYILNSVFKDRFDEFVLIRDNQQCCFGPGAKLYHNMQVKIEGGKEIKYTTRPVRVEGTFELSPYIAPDNKCYSVFKCVAKSVEK